MAQILAGQIVRAVDLNYPRIYRETLSGGPTSGATELVIATLVVPAQPIDTIQVLSVFGSLQPDTPGALDRWVVSIKNSNTSGTLQGQQNIDIGGASGGGSRLPFAISNIPVPVAANTSATYVATLYRGLSRQNGVASPHGATSSLTAMILPDRS